MDYSIASALFAWRCVFNAAMHYCIKLYHLFKSLYYVRKLSTLQWLAKLEEKETGEAAVCISFKLY